MKMMEPSHLRKMNPLEMVRQRPEFYLGQNRNLHPHILANHLKFQAIILGAESVALLRRGHWWIICSDTDWMAAPKDEDWLRRGKPTDDLFTRFVVLGLPYPYDEFIAGELVANAMTKHTIARVGGQTYAFGVAVEPSNLIWQHMADAPYQTCILAYYWPCSEDAIRTS